jgi:DNA-binding transcriptional ArsR family regulator
VQAWLQSRQAGWLSSISAARDMIHPRMGWHRRGSTAAKVDRTLAYPYGNASSLGDVADIRMDVRTLEASMVSVRHDHPVDPERVAHARERGISAEDAGRLSGLLSLLSDPSRARILYALDLVEELCVGDLALALDLSEDAVSYALKLLRTAGLVQARKQGRVVFYRLASRFPEPLLEHCLRQLIALSRVAAEEEDTR